MSFLSNELQKTKTEMKKDSFVWALLTSRRLGPLVPWVGLERGSGGELRFG